ncbi:MAG: sigma-70 family RNA polymerase sigma factor [Bacteroidota bacterium]
MNNISAEDQAVIQALRAGGDRRERQLADLYRQYFGYVWKGVDDNQGISPDQAKDAYTDAIIGFSHMIEKGDFRGESSLSTLLFRIFQLKIIDLIRARNTGKAEFINKLERDLPDQLKSTEGSPESSYLTHEQFLLIQELLPKAGSNCLEIFLLMEYYGYSAKEIAKKLDLKNAATVRVRKKQCKDKVIKLYQQQEPIS